MKYIKINGKRVKIPKEIAVHIGQLEDKLKSAQELVEDVLFLNTNCTSIGQGRMLNMQVLAQSVKI